MADSSDVCLTEDAFKAFLEYLVDPVLPAKPSTRDNSPSPSQHQLVAKQELDGICRENSWLLRIYRVSESNGGFQVTVAVQGLDFECSCGGNLCSHPREARESAAAQMLANLRNMAKSEALL